MWHMSGGGAGRLAREPAMAMPTWLSGVLHRCWAAAPAGVEPPLASHLQCPCLRQGARRGQACWCARLFSFLPPDTNACSLNNTFHAAGSTWTAVASTRPPNEPPRRGRSGRPSARSVRRPPSMPAAGWSPLGRWATPWPRRQRGSRACPPDSSKSRHGLCGAHKRLRERGGGGAAAPGRGRHAGPAEVRA